MTGTGSSSVVFDNNASETTNNCWGGGAGGNVARFIMENALFNQIEIDGAFIELMGYLREHNVESYRTLVHMARDCHQLRAAWQLIMVDVLLGLNLAELADDDSLFFETAPLLCRHRNPPGCEPIIAACFDVYAGSIALVRRDFIRSCILNAR